MRSLDEKELSVLLEGAHTIEADGYGLKVARLGNGDFLKLFRRKRLFSSALWSPPAHRFADNARRLVQLGIPAPPIIETFLVPSRQLNGVHYQPLPGLTLRDYWRTLEPAQRDTEIERFGQFIGQLHQLGVYFRSLHLGNVLQLPKGPFGLIDLSDMKIENGPLAASKCRRNLQHMLRYEEDIQWLTAEHRSALLKGYARSRGELRAEQLALGIERLHPA